MLLQNIMHALLLSLLYPLLITSLMKLWVGLAILTERQMTLGRSLCWVNWCFNDFNWRNDNFMKKVYRNLNPLTSLKNHFHNNATFQDKCPCPINYIKILLLKRKKFISYKNQISIFRNSPKTFCITIYKFIKFLLGIIAYLMHLS